MGLPAVRIDSTSRERRSHLRVVKTKKQGKSSSRARSSAARSEAARGAFRSFAILMTLVVVLGMGRVWLSVMAAEASMAASELRSQIKTARYQGDMLEVRQSALGSPSRIRAIACDTMDMTPARKIACLDISCTTTVRPSVNARRPSGSRGMDRALEGLMDLTAGEAQVLLVGDVGLASSR